LIQHLNDANIGTGIHYPVPLHLQQAYRHLGYRMGDFPIAERAAAEVLSLPMFPTLSLEQQRRVVGAVVSFEAIANPSEVKTAKVQLAGA
jgi:dTDP-4-amino-4,6-dideoxygalactose transaminase